MTTKEIIELTNKSTNLNKRMESASIQAAQYFEQHKIKHAFFEEQSEMQLTSELCKRIYYDMVEKCLNNNYLSLFEYGLIVRMMPIKTEGILIPWFDFGVVFVSDSGMADV